MIHPSQTSELMTLTNTEKHHSDWLLLAMVQCNGMQYHSLAHYTDFVPGLPVLRPVKFDFGLVKEDVY